MTSGLTYNDLRSALAGGAAAFRLILKLDAVSPKVFPPTYEGGKYATETRRINGNEVPCVLLDSVPSQANRMELALQDAWESSLIELPVVSTDFSNVENAPQPKITSLQAPHRIADAILRDSYLGESRFRSSDVGHELDHLSIGNATALLKYAPHCLIFGMWDSTGPRGGAGVKFARALVSEIIGLNAVPGVKTSSRLDPLNIRVNSGVLYTGQDGWTLNEKKAKVEKGKPVRLGKDGKPSEANHGNVTPSVSDGGFTIDYAEQTTVLSLAGLRKLRFPIKSDGRSTPDTDLIARSYLVALGLLATTLALDAGYDLRSRCVLRATDAIQWTLLGRPGDADKQFDLSSEHAIELYRQALCELEKVGLPIQKKEIVLKPSADLVTLVVKSMELAAADKGAD